MKNEEFKLETPSTQTDNMAPLKPGVYTALVTPFSVDGTSVDWGAFFS
jgi:hypothetical protein